MIRRRTRVTDIAQRRTLGERMDVWVPRCWNGGLALVSAVDPRQGGQTTSNASRGAAGHKRHKTVEFGTPFKRPISNSGRLAVDMMMTMSIIRNTKRFTLKFNFT
ncbi:jg16671 [Pararge aegeria aegeria]|uniref:Jg16671 protein n=1 Tax=Pararge aegeria aegeria TaxID=348720 RepID=A0A8S4RFR9_9NEOP|nr:jg16671 [Pararge aegeria aegeria]